MPLGNMTALPLKSSCPVSGMPSLFLRGALWSRCGGPAEQRRLLKGIGKPDELRFAPLRAEQFNADWNTEWGARRRPGKAPREGESWKPRPMRFSTGQILTHFKVDICEMLAHRIHHPNRMEIPLGGA